MEKISPTNVAALCSSLFGLGIERERVETLVPALTSVLGEIQRLRELDLSEVAPVVVFDPARVYEEGRL